MSLLSRIAEFWRGPVIPAEPPAASPETALDAAILKAAMPHAAWERCRLYAPHLEAARAAHGIEWGRETAHWLAQIAHESGSLRYVEEIAGGDAYEGRRDLGNVRPGDGRRFKGRGLIQLTGRANYERYNYDNERIERADRNPKLVTPPFVEYPERLCQPYWAADVAGWFWRVNGCGEWARRDDLRAVSGIVNAGSPTAKHINGLADRAERLAEAKKGLGVA